MRFWLQSGGNTRVIYQAKSPFSKLRRVEWEKLKLQHPKHESSMLTPVVPELFIMLLYWQQRNASPIWREWIISSIHSKIHNMSMPLEIISAPTSQQESFGVNDHSLILWHLSAQFYYSFLRKLSYKCQKLIVLSLASSEV